MVKFRMAFPIKTFLTFLCLFLLTLNGLSAHPYFIKDLGTPAEEASSARRIQQARAVETEGRRLQNVGKQLKEATHPVPKLQAGGTAPKPKVVEKALKETPAKEISLSRSKKMDAPGQGVTTPNATAQQNALKLPYRFKPQQYFDSPQRAVQPTTAPQRAVQSTTAPQIGAQLPAPSSSRPLPPAPGQVSTPSIRPLPLLQEQVPSIRPLPTTPGQVSTPSIRPLPPAPGQVSTVAPPRAVQPTIAPQHGCSKGM